MYQPSRPPDDAPATQWAARELANVGRQLEQDVTQLIFTPLYAAPGRIYPGMQVLFDASAPDAASGEGYYRRNIANTAWVFVG